MRNPLSALRDLRGPLAVLAAIIFVGQLGIDPIWEYSDIRIALALTGLMAALGGLTLNLLPRDPRPVRLVEPAVTGL